MAVTYTPIASTILSSTASSVSFSSLTTSYTDLVIRAYCQSALGGGPNSGYLGIQFNGTSVSSGFFRNLLTGSTTETSSSSLGFASINASSTDNGSYFTTSEIYIPSYQQNNYHVIRSLTGVEYAGNLIYTSAGGNGVYTSQTITSIALFPNTTFAVGSRFDLYGILKY